MLNRTTGEIRFGDGRNGNIPVANPANPEGNIVAREYRFGGGKQGNVAAGAIKTLTTSIDGIDANAVANLLAADSGRDEETLDEAKKRAPHAIRSRCRAVTAEDFEYLAMEASSIKRAKALPLFHPDFPGVKVPGVVTVIVVPDGDGPVPTPSEGTLRTRLRLSRSAAAADDRAVRHQADLPASANPRRDRRQRQRGSWRSSATRSSRRCSTIFIH